jgi:16S rRNA (guanine527-N7)-methyltransferase
MTDDKNLMSLLRSGLQQMRIDLSIDAQQKLLAYVALLAKWSKAYNLTTVREPEQIITLHILDSLSVLPFLDITTSVLDVGTGAGLPGLPLAIARPDISFKLLDSQQKKIIFVQHVITSLQLTNVVATQQRIESLQVSSPVDPGFDVIVSRAFASLQEFVNLISSICTKQTKIIAMKGRRELVLQEAGLLPPHYQLVNIETVTVPGVNGERCLVFLKIKEE